MPLLCKKWWKALAEQREGGQLLHGLTPYSAFINTPKSIKNSQPPLQLFWAMWLEFSPMIRSKGCITLKDQLNIINFSFILGSDCCPYPEGPWVTIQLQRANYITTWKGDELSFDQAKELKLSVTWGHLNVFDNTPLSLFTFWHHRLRAIWTRSPVTYPRLASDTRPTAAASDTRARQTDKSQHPAPISP